jgi:hypothetical protein
MPVLIEEERISNIENEPLPDIASAISAVKYSLVSNLSGGRAVWYGEALHFPLPETMLQAVSFDDELDDRLNVVQLRPVDESEDNW